MPDINIPPQIQALEATSELINRLKDLSDPVAKKRIEDDIKAYHALSADEAKKHQDALAAIAKNQSLLEAATSITEENEKAVYLLNQEREIFESEKKAALADIAEQRDNNAADLVSNQSLYGRSMTMQSDVNAREGRLRDAQAAHDKNVQKFETDKLSFAQSQKDLEAMRDELKAESETLNAKKEALKKLVNN
jgi:hypothetical protein